MHSDHQVAQIAASIREFGFTNPVLIDEEDGIIAGHGRVLAAQALALFLIGIIRAIDEPIAAEQMSLAGPGKPGS